MNKQQVIDEYCKLQGLVFHSVKDYSHSSDGFCSKCAFSNYPEYFRHSGETIKYIRDAVIEKLQKDSRVDVKSLEDAMKTYRSTSILVDEDVNEIEGAD